MAPLPQRCTSGRTAVASSWWDRPDRRRSSPDRWRSVQTLELPAETLALYDPEFAISSQNFTRTPNFPTAARLFQSKIAAQEGFAVDGVVSLDPVVLADILSVAGGVNVDGIDINAENAVKILLSDTYFRFPG